MKYHLMRESAVAPVIPSDAISPAGTPELASPAAGPAYVGSLNTSQLNRTIADREQTLARPTIEWGPVLILSALLILLYHSIAVKLVTDWGELPDFSHGFLIPFFAAFVIWEKRYEIRTTPIVPTWAGIWLVALGLFELLLGVFGADLFVQRTSFILLVAGLIWTLLGKAMLGRLKFVLFVLLLAIPLPTILFNQITFPLQILRLPCRQFASARRRAGAARGQHHPVAGDAAGGRRGVQRHSLADEPLHRGRDLRLLP
jgi:hypothetical protein